MIKEKYNQWRLSYQIGRIRTIGYIHKLWASLRNDTTVWHGHENHQYLTRLEKIGQLRSLVYKKVETSDHFKKRGETEKPYE